MKLYIKYMVSKRCKMLVKEELTNLGLHFVNVDLGMVEIMENITPQQRTELKAALLKSGLELMEDKKAFSLKKYKMSSSKWSIIRMNYPGLIFRITYLKN